MRAKTFAYLFASSLLAAAVGAESHPTDVESSQVAPGEAAARTPVNGTNRPLIHSHLDAGASDASRTPVNGTNRPLIQDSSI